MVSHVVTWHTLVLGMHSSRVQRFLKTVFENNVHKLLVKAEIFF